nr:hypothetical protein [Tanacetum cinerariifolium]
MHKAFPLPVESSHWQYKFPLPVEGVPTARRMEIPLPRVCTAMMKKLPVKENWELQATDRRRQTVISELLRIDHKRSTEISELRTALQGQGLAGDHTQLELPEEAGGSA